MLGYPIFLEVMLFLVTVVNTSTEAVVQRCSYYKFCKTEYKDLLLKNIFEIDQATTVVPDWLCLIDKENIKLLVTQKLPSAAVLQKSFSEKIRNFLVFSEKFLTMRNFSWHITPPGKYLQSCCQDLSKHPKWRALRQ